MPAPLIDPHRPGALRGRYIAVQDEEPGKPPSCSACSATPKKGARWPYVDPDWQDMQRTHYACDCGQEFITEGPRLPD